MALLVRRGPPITGLWERTKVEILGEEIRKQKRGAGRVIRIRDGATGNSMTSERGGGGSGGGSYHIPDSSPSPSGNSGIIRPGLHSPVPPCPTQSPAKPDASMMGVGSQRSQEEVDDDDEFLIQHLLKNQPSTCVIRAAHHHSSQSPADVPDNTPAPQPPVHHPNQ
ncbi:hypothetical protein CRENBAI_018218 [Crenichthys baileyi]|uniref:Uncharacterized protein n=1 Tax=Crenichthys baileyi TaxID=28760 RepID=A0AAV9SI79_9TELE